MWVGSCGTQEKRWAFDTCPGYYLRGAITVDGVHTAFDFTWRSHWAFIHGHGIGNPPPPKLMQAIELYETEIRAREALKMQASEERAKQKEKQSRSGYRVIARG